MVSTKGLDLLISEARSRKHRSFFIFTCRPTVNVLESTALHLNLKGLSSSETAELLRSRGISKGLDLVDELHALTEGHPLWISLAAMHACRNGGQLSAAVQMIRAGESKISTTARSIWNTLNDQQKLVLRTMAELDHPEQEEHLLELLPGVNFNRINKAFKSLKSFHLVEVRAWSGDRPHLGLHPVIREFVRSEFPKKDREKHIGPILSFFDRMIGKFKGQLSRQPSFEILQHWIHKTDIQLNFGRYPEALETLAEVMGALEKRGFSEELLRVTLRLFQDVDWAEACSSYRLFDTLVRDATRILAELDREPEARHWLSRYRDTIPGKSAQYINYCSSQCYVSWFTKKFEDAIMWGEEGQRLKEATGVDTDFSCDHTLALARRDSGDWRGALSYFLAGAELEAVVAPGHIDSDKDYAFYGNVGRCLYTGGEYQRALECYKKSAQLLAEDDDERSRINKGFACAWIAEACFERQDGEGAATAWLAARLHWTKTAPARAIEVSARLEDLFRVRPDLARLASNEEWEIESAFRRLVSRLT